MASEGDGWTEGNAGGLRDGRCSCGGYRSRATGIHLALYADPSSCRAEPAAAARWRTPRDARRGADVIGIPFYVWDMADRFHSYVVQDFVAEYAMGRTRTRACAVTKRSSSRRCSTRRWLSPSTRHQGLPARQLGRAPSRIVDQVGAVVGEHAYAFTVGQRRGLVVCIQRLQAPLGARHRAGDQDGRRRAAPPSGPRGRLPRRPRRHSSPPSSGGASRRQKDGGLVPSDG